MSNMRYILNAFGVLVLVATLSSFTVLAENESSKSNSSSDNVAMSDQSNTNDDQGKEEKRSREEIFSGNQQEQPSGLVDDLMMNDDEGAFDAKASVSHQGDSGQSKEEADDKRSGRSEEYSNDMAQDPDNWYVALPAALPVTSDYLSNGPGLHRLPSPGYGSRLYDQEDLYRRKRQLLKSPLPLRRRRSLRNSLGEMIQQRGLRMPRRSMRLKRQANLYTWLGNDAFYDDQAQVPQQQFEEWENKMMKRRVQGRFGSHPGIANPSPLAFRHTNGGVLSDLDSYKEDTQQEPSYDDIDSLMLLPPNGRYIDDSDLSFLPYRITDEEKEALQKWLARYTIPNTLEVSRRSAPFYPIDYRYMPGYKKRNIFSHGNRMPQHFSEDMDESEPEIGSWGRVVQTPEAYASPEDVARLYGLASLMAEGDEETRVKRNV